MKILAPLDIDGWASRKHRAAALDYAASVARPGLWVEAGVADGWSARYLLNRLPSDGMLHVFDSFHGLPDDWDERHPKGAFAVERVPLFDDSRVLCIAGMFEFSLPAYARACPFTIDLLHVDCDLYASTMTVLRALGHRLRAGSFIAFDEAVGSPAAEANEGKALRDWLNESGRVVTPVAKTEYTQLIVRVDA